MDLDTIRSVALLALGFGFVVFWHELGHFLAAKWAGVKVEQFAVGFGQALLAWRKGLGLRVGTTYPAFRRRVVEHVRAKDPNAFPPGQNVDEIEPTEMQVMEAAKELGISETEYRLNWIPLGGYVKMLGQDDLRPNSEAADPRAYNRQTIAKRMVIVSAGVIMNVILAAFGFMVLFLVGFNVPPAFVGSVQPGSPAQRAGMRVGDQIVAMDGTRLHNDWTKVQLNSALSRAGEPIPVVIRRGDLDATVTATPEKAGGPSKDFVGLGIGPATSLRGLDPDDKAVAETFKDKAQIVRTVGRDMLAVLPGDVITAIDGKPVAEHDFAALDRAVQASNGEPVVLAVRGADGTERTESVHPKFMTPFGDDPLNFGGMVPRVGVASVQPGASVAKSSKEGLPALQPGDVVTAVSAGAEGAEVLDPSFDEFRKVVRSVSPDDRTLKITVLRDDGREWVVGDLTTVEIERGAYGLGIGQGYDDGNAVVAAVLPNSPAQVAKVPQGARVVSVNGQPVRSWHDVRRMMADWANAHAPGTPAAAPLPIEYVTRGGERRAASLDLTPDAAAQVVGARYHLPTLALDAPKTPRKAASAVKALEWGVTETRDFILQFYLTLRRMVTGDVSPKNMMGPVGIFQAGTSFASKGGDWLLWFLAMISANLAVVNFLPIPIVDGGLFAFLILEKIKGKPLSPKTMAIAQYVGLALLLGIFLFVTYQDVANFRFRMR